MPLSVEEVKRYGDYWQKVLRLTNWTIEYRVVPQSELSSPTSYGEVFWDRFHLYARVLICDPDTVDDKDPITPFNVEQIVLHELLHLYTAPIQWPYEDTRNALPLPLWEKVSEDSNMAEEQAINQISRALIELRYSALKE